MGTADDLTNTNGFIVTHTSKGDMATDMTNIKGFIVICTLSMGMVADRTNSNHCILIRTLMVRMAGAWVSLPTSSGLAMAVLAWGLDAASCGYKK